MQIEPAKDSLESSGSKVPFTTRDKNRFEALLLPSYRKVYHFAYRLSGNRSDAEDITQEAFLRAYRSFGDYRADKPFENWVMKITSRLFLDHLRAKARCLTTVSFDEPMTTEGSDGLYYEAPDPNSNPENLLLSDMFGEDLIRAIRSLSDEQRLLVKMADLQKVSYREIAQTLDKPIGTIQSRLHRARRLLQDSLENTRLPQRAWGP